MKQLTFSIAILLVSAACSSDNDDGGGAGAGGSGATGGAAGSGGSPGSGGGTAGGSGGSGVDVECVELFEDLFIQLQEAAVCDDTADAATECSGAVYVPDTCGCEQVINDAHADPEALRTLSDEYRERCGTEGCAGVQCVEPTTATCEDVGDGAGARCRWVLE